MIPNQVTQTLRNALQWSICILQIILFGVEGKGLVDFVGEEYHEMELHSKVSTVVTLCYLSFVLRALFPAPNREPGT